MLIFTCSITFNLSSGAVQVRETKTEQNKEILSILKKHGKCGKQKKQRLYLHWLANGNIDKIK